MASTAGESITPGYATSARPGVWLTDLSLVFVAFVWGVNFSIVKFGTTLVDPLAYNGLRIALAAVVLAIIVALGRAALDDRRAARTRRAWQRGLSVSLRRRNRAHAGKRRRARRCRVARVHCDDR